MALPTSAQLRRSYRKVQGRGGRFRHWPGIVLLFIDRGNIQCLVRLFVVYDILLLVSAPLTLTRVGAFFPCEESQDASRVRKRVWKVVLICTRSD